MVIITHRVHDFEFKMYVNMNLTNICISTKKWFGGDCWCEGVIPGYEVIKRIGCLIVWILTLFWVFNLVVILIYTHEGNPKQNNTINTIGILLEIFTHRNYCMFEIPSKKPVQNIHSWNIQKYKPPSIKSLRLWGKIYNKS